MRSSTGHSTGATINAKLGLIETNILRTFAELDAIEIEPMPEAVCQRYARLSGTEKR